jgi:hypothetical protein
MVWLFALLTVLLYAVVGVLTMLLVKLSITERELTLKEKVLACAVWPAIWFREFIR